MLNGSIPPREAADFPLYWQQASVPSDSLTLSLEDESHDEASDCTVRRLRSKFKDLEWCGTQLSVSWWPDQDAPPLDKFFALDHLVNAIVMSHEGEPPPVIVHCAGGIGRA